MSKYVSIVIIGGGASGTLTALNLLRKLNVPATIYLVEKRKEAIYRGNAYSSKLVYEPLNVPAGRMSAFNHLPDDFYYWLKKKKQTESATEITKDSFVSRRWYGDYMEERITGAVEQVSHITFETLNAEAREINFNESVNAYSIVLDSGTILTAHYLVFATGNEAPNDVFKQEELASLNGHYISNPWAVDPLKDINNEDDVLIIGTGLTMVDHVVSLRKREHRGKIFCFSRNGFLPLPHSELHQNFVFEFNDSKKGLDSILSEIKRNIDRSEKNNIDWQNTLDAMRGKTTRIWKLMSTDSRRLFVKRLRSFWEIHRHRMPRASAEMLGLMRASGQLEILSGKSLGIETEANNAVFRFIPKGIKEEKMIRAHRIINCTGPSGDYFKTGNDLIKSLLTKGWVKQDELKLGIVTGVRGEIIQTNGVILQNAFSIGPLRKAMEWETTAIREIRTQAEETAAYISSRIELKHDMTLEIGL